MANLIRRWLQSPIPRRIWAFLIGDMQTAEGLGDYPELPRVGWVDTAASANKGDLVQYALEAAQRSANDANDAVKSIQDKASGFLTLLVGLIPILIAAIGLASPSGAGSPARWLAFLLFLVAATSILGAVALTAMAVGLNLGGGLAVSRLDKDLPKPTLIGLKANEVDAWHQAAVLAMETSHRKAADLFRARQLAVWALTCAVLATAMLIASAGGDVGQLGDSASPAASAGSFAPATSSSARP